MRILLVGDGAREHALAQKIGRSAELYCVMSRRNPGIEEFSQASFISDFSRVESIGLWAIKRQIDIALVTSEVALAKGLSDALADAKIRLASPTIEAAVLGENTAYAYNLMKESGTPIPDYAVCHNEAEMKKAIRRFKRVVMKPSVKVEWKGAKFIDEDFKKRKMVLEHGKKLIKRHGSVILEELVDGERFSVQAFCDGKHLAAMPPVQTARRAYEGRGALTEGMGSYCSPMLPFLKDKDYKTAYRALQALLSRLRKRGIDYRGVLHGSFIASKNGVLMVDVDSTFGTLETINNMPLLRVQLSEILNSIAIGNLTVPYFREKAAVAKLVVPKTYPSVIRKPRPIRINERGLWDSGSKAYFDSVMKKGKQFYLTAGRGVILSATGKDIEEARQRVESATSFITGDVRHRADVATSDYIERTIKHLGFLRSMS